MKIGSSSAGCCGRKDGGGGDGMRPPQEYLTGARWEPATVQFLL